MKIDKRNIECKVKLHISGGSEIDIEINPYASAIEVYDQVASIKGRKREDFILFTTDHEDHNIFTAGSFVDFAATHGFTKHLQLATKAQYECERLDGPRRTMPVISGVASNPTALTTISSPTKMNSANMNIGSIVLVAVGLGIGIGIGIGI